MDLLNSFNGEDGELLQQLASLNWLNTGNTEPLHLVTGAQVASGLWQRLSGGQDIDALRNQTIMNIAKYVQDHPNASKDELVKEIGKQIHIFRKAVDKM